MKLKIILLRFLNDNNTVKIIKFCILFISLLLLNHCFKIILFIIRLKNYISLIKCNLSYIAQVT